MRIKRCGCSPSAHRHADIERVRREYQKQLFFWTRKLESVIDIQAVHALEEIVRCTTAMANKNMYRQIATYLHVIDNH